MMDRLSEMQHGCREVGHVFRKPDGKISCEGIESGRLTDDQAMKEIIYAWNDLDWLLDQCFAMLEDHSRMTKTLVEITRSAADVMQGTSRLPVPEDWWADK